MCGKEHQRRIAVPAALGCCLIAYLLVAANPADAATRSDATVRTEEGIALKVRVGPSTQSRRVQALPRSTRVSVICQVQGQWIRGDVRATAAWSRLARGGYVSDAYLAHRNPRRAVPRCDIARPGALSPAQTAFIRSIVRPAQRGFRESGVPASVTMAQATLESGWGRSALAVNGRNYFGIKCFGGPGPNAVGCRSYRTHECSPVACFSTVALFEVYRTATDSFREHGRFLRANRRYAQAFRYSTDPNQFAAQIHRAGYATDPLYTDKLVGLMRAYNLYQYDR